jgi:hypothetical protein
MISESYHCKEPVDIEYKRFNKKDYIANLSKNKIGTNGSYKYIFGVITFSPHELPKNAGCPHELPTRPK